MHQSGLLPVGNKDKIQEESGRCYPGIPVSTYPVRHMNEHQQHWALQLLPAVPDVPSSCRVRKQQTYRERNTKHEFINPLSIVLA